MENQNEQNNTETKAPAVGGVGRSALAAAVLRATGREPEQKTDEGAEKSAGTPPDNAALDLLAGTDDSTALAGSAEPGEGEPETVDVWNFNGVDYTVEQVEESLREREVYQRYNQSVQPMADAIKQAEEATARYKDMALTETEKRIEQLQAAIKSGQLDPRQKAAAYDQLDEANQRHKYLTDAAEMSLKAQREAMDKVRRQRAAQTVTALTRQKWSAEEIKAIGANLEKVVGDKIGDVISPELMQVFRDSAELHRLRNDNAKRLGKKVNETSNALKATKKPLTKPVQKEVEAKSFGQKVWGDRYK